MSYSVFFSYLFLFMSFYLLTNHFLNKIRNHPPSPFFCFPIIGHLYLARKPLHRTLAQISTRYGPVVLLRFGDRTVVTVSNASAAEECFSKNDIIFANRPRILFAEHVAYNSKSLVWSSYGERWRNLRRLATLEILSSHRLQILAEIRSDEVRSLIRSLLPSSEPDRTVKINSVLFEMTLNVMMRMIAGKRYSNDGAVKKEEITRFKEIVLETFQLGQLGLWDYFSLFRWAGLGKKRMMELRNKRDTFIQDFFDEQKKINEKEDFESARKHAKTMLEVMLALQKKDPENYNDEIIQSIPLTLLAAATDTTVNTMEWALSLLLNHPHILRKLQSEIDGHTSHRRLIDESDLPHLPYLRSIINETFRMYPPGPLLIPHQSSADCIIGGFHIPRDTTLLVNAWAIHNDPDVWDCPGEFRPERFDETEAGRSGFKFMPFGAGRRKCPGDGLAMRVVGLTLGCLVQCFEWERIGEEMVDMTDGSALTLPRAEPLIVKCRPRQAMMGILLEMC